MTNAWQVAIPLVGALLIAWFVYRLQRSEERRGVLSALVAELQLQEDWVGRGGYGSWSEDWWDDPAGGPRTWTNVVFKLSTVATDNAIQAGPALFVREDLVRTLVRYRQRAHQLNQLIDDMAAFRAAPDLWVESDRQEELRRHLSVLARMVHEGGIGNHTGDGANRHYLGLREALRAERCAGCWRRWGWFWLGLSQRAKDTPDASW